MMKHNVDDEFSNGPNGINKTVMSTTKELSSSTPSNEDISASSGVATTSPSSTSSSSIEASGKQEVNQPKKQTFKHRFYSILKNNIWLSSFVASVLIPIGCFGPYFVTSQKGLVEPIWPFVSDAGGMLPAASYFSQFLDMVAILVSISIWARYKQIKYYVNNKQLKENSDDQEKASTSKISDVENWIHRKNFHSLIFSWIAIFGTIIIGNFRSPDNLTGHLIGVFFLFNFFMAYIFNMTMICETLYKYGQVESRPISMVINLAIYLLSFFGCATFATIATLHHGSLTKYWETEFRTHFTPDMDGYIYHCFGTAFEWLAILSFSPFIYMIGRRQRLFQHWHRVSFCAP